MLKIENLNFLVNYKDNKRNQKFQLFSRPSVSFNGAKGFSLKNISLEVHPGEYFIIVGPTGSGKTILLKCISGLVKYSSGDIFLNGIKISELLPEQRQIGYLPQNYLLFPHLNVSKNILYSLDINKVEKTEKLRRLNDIAETFGISELLERAVGDLSGGEKQRVALARTLINRPKLVLLDEPFSAIDVGLRLKLWFDIKDVMKRMKIPVVHVTHNIEEAAALGDNIAVMIEGAIEKIGKPAEVFQKPATEKIARYLGIANIFEGKVVEVGISDKGTGSFVRIAASGAVFTVNNEKNLKAGQTVKICIRPQDIKIIRPGVPLKDELKNNVFIGKIVSECFYEDTCGLRVKSRLDLDLKFPSYIYKRHGLSLGKEVTVAIWQPSICVFPVEGNKSCQII